MAITHTGIQVPRAEMRFEGRDRRFQMINSLLKRRVTTLRGEINGFEWAELILEAMAITEKFL